MKRVKQSWMAMLMGALLLGTLVGAVWARPQNRPQAQDITRKITIPAAFFSPPFEGQDSVNNGNYIKMTSGGGAFMAPVVFPCLPSVTVERLILYVDDNNASADACAGLRRTRLPQGDEVDMAYVCSSGTTSGVQPLIDSAISPNVVWPSHGVYAWISLYTSMRVYGIRIEYHRNL